MQIKGFFIREIFRNHQNGYAIIVIRTEKKDITCAGCIQQLGYYTPVCLDGNFGINEQYPETFIIEKINNWGDNEQSDMERVFMETMETMETR